MRYKARDAGPLPLGACRSNCCRRPRQAARRPGRESWTPTVPALLLLDADRAAAGKRCNVAPFLPVRRGSAGAAALPMAPAGYQSATLHFDPSELACRRPAASSGVVLLLLDAEPLK
jgi:hypothetical protein